MDLNPEDARRRPGGYTSHGLVQSPGTGPPPRNFEHADRYHRYETDAHYGTQTGNPGFRPPIFASPQTQAGPASQSRPLTLKELEQMSRGPSSATSQSLSSQFAGNSLFGGQADGSGGAVPSGTVGGGHGYPQQGQQVGGGNGMAGFVYQQQHQLGGGQQQQSLFGDAFFQGMAATAGGQGGASMGRVNALNGMNDVRGPQSLNTAPPGYPGNAHLQSTTQQGSAQFTSNQQRQSMQSLHSVQMDQLSALFGQQTVGGLHSGVSDGPAMTSMPSTGLPSRNAIDPLEALRRGTTSMTSMSPMPTIQHASPNVGLTSPLPAISTSPQTRHVAQSRPGETTINVATSESVSTPTSTQHYQKQSREDRWVDIMDHTHTGRTPVADMAALDTALLGMAEKLSPKDDDVNAWRQALSYVQNILKTTLGSSLKDVSLFGSSANGLAVHGNNDIDVSAMVDLGDDGRVLDAALGLYDDEIEAREAAIHQKKADIIEELGLALQRDLEARFGPDTDATNAINDTSATDTAGTKDERSTQGSPTSSPFNLLVLPNARVPVIKFTYPPTKTQVDITINNNLACLNTRLIACYAGLDERVGQLVHIVKHWAKRRHVNDPYTGTLSSYCYVLMCIFHCQTRNPPILPNLQDERLYPMTVDTVVDSWKVAFLDDVTRAKQAFKSQNTQSLASLVWEFFEFWAWKHSYPHDVISIRNGRIISKASKDWTKRIGRDRHLVCVEDPFVLSHDLGRTVDMRSKDVIRKEFFRAATVLRDYDDCFTLLFEPYRAEKKQRTPSSSKRGGRDRERGRYTRGR